MSDTDTTKGVKMKQLNANNEAEAKNEAIAISVANPGKYVRCVQCFGIMAVIEKRLHVFAPSDVPLSFAQGGWYAINGKLKKYTEKQIATDWAKTPVMA